MNNVNSVASNKLDVDINEINCRKRENTLENIKSSMKYFTIGTLLAATGYAATYCVLKFKNRNLPKFCPQKPQPKK